MIKTLAASLVLIGSLALSSRAEEAKTPAPAKAKKSAKAKAAKPSTAHEKFLTLDGNKDGSIDKTELEAYEKLVTESKNKDGKAMDEKAAAEIRASLEAEFKKEDTSNDGKVSEKEFDSEDKAAAAPAKK